MEAHEVQEFANQMKESGEGHEDHARDTGESLTRISLAISILAVLVAMVTVLGHRSHTEAVLMQSRAADQWNEYQAKKIRSDNTQGSIDLLTLQPSINPAGVEKKIEEYRTHMEKWKDELAEEQRSAKEMEAEVHHAEAKATRFDLGEAMLQISVVLCSVTLFTRRRLYFFLGLAIGTAGVLCALLAFAV